jgi:predicted secreted protein
MNTHSMIARISRALCLFAALAGLAAVPVTLSAMASKPAGVVVEFKDGEVVVQQNNEKAKAGDRAKVEVTLVAGQRLKLRLRGNITTGFSWAITGEVPACLVAVGEPKYIEDESHGAVGVGGWSEFEFMAKTSGSGALQLANRRPWETKVPAAESLTVRVKVPAVKLQK